MADGTFVTAINCMDGRVQEPVIAWMKATFAADWVDAITTAGPLWRLASPKDSRVVDRIQRRVGISVGKHGSKVVAVIGHHDCAGNPVDEATQREQIASALTRIRGWDLGVELLGLWVDSDWIVHRVEE